MLLAKYIFITESTKDGKILHADFWSGKELPYPFTGFEDMLLDNEPEVISMTIKTQEKKYRLQVTSVMKLPDSFVA